jgi:PilZ domain-containing protein
MSERPQRQGERIQPFLASCRVTHGGRRFAGHVIELSREGGRIACKAPPPQAGASVVLEVRFGKEPGRTRLPAEVRWSGPQPNPQDGHLFGVTFSAPDEAGRAVEAVLAEFRRRAAAI